MIDVSRRHLKAILAILKKRIPDYEVRVFGSRVNQKAKKYSDLDLAVVGKAKLPRTILYSLKDDFEESDLPFRVDILDWYLISENFKKIIQAQCEVIQTAWPEEQRR